MDILKLNYDKWKKSNLNYFQKDHLSLSQSPKYMVITCSDSRIDPNAMFGLSPGELFVFRNIGGIIHDIEQDSSVIAAVEYAVKILKIQKILLMMHTGCGAAQYIYDNCNKNNDGSLIAKNLLNSEYKKYVSQYATEGISNMTKMIIIKSYKNLMSYDFIYNAVNTNILEIEKLIFDIKSLEITKIN
jgi:carbonic anhydrase